MLIPPNKKPKPEGFETYTDAKKRRAHKIEILRGGNAQEQLSGSHHRLDS